MAAVNDPHSFDYHAEKQQAVCSCGWHITQTSVIAGEIEHADHVRQALRDEAGS